MMTALDQEEACCMWIGHLLMPAPAEQPRDNMLVQLLPCYCLAGNA